MNNQTILEQVRVVKQGLNRYDVSLSNMFWTYENPSLTCGAMVRMPMLKINYNVSLFQILCKILVIIDILLAP